MRLGLGIAAVVFVLDQISKSLILSHFRPDGMTETPYFTFRVIELLPFLNFRLAWNYGISFSMFDFGPGAGAYILSAVALALSAGLIWWLRQQTDLIMKIGLGLIIGGAIGNVIDRLRYGAVVDFIDVHGWGAHFPTFNVADSAITIGAACILLDAAIKRPQSDTNPDTSGSS